VKFVLFVEGETEQKVLPGFLKRWLDTKLEERVGIQAVPLSRMV
jgi:predicted ATP-dependent endonuclease of OLD family